MAELVTDDVTLHYEDVGHGAPVVLLHGFGMTAEACWGSHGWYELLSNHGLRAIALDSRGHGASSKFTDPDRYDANKMKQDVLDLLDHLEIGKANFIGHSMGARTVLNLAVENPERVSAAVLVSVGDNVFTSPNTEALREALLSDDMSLLPPQRAQFVQMLLSLGNEASALAAYCGNPRPAMSPEYVAAIEAPVLIVCGDQDPVVGEPGKLAIAIRNAEAKLVSGYEHTNILGSDELRQMVPEFFLDL